MGSAVLLLLVFASRRNEPGDTTATNTVSTSSDASTGATAPAESSTATAASGQSSAAESQATEAGQLAAVQPVVTAATHDPAQTNTVTLEGWLVGETTVWVDIDGEPAMEAPTNGPALTPSLPAGAVGFEVEISVPSGRHELCVRTSSEPPSLRGCVNVNAGTLLPHNRVVAYYGSPRSPILGTLGVGTPQEAAQRLLADTASFDDLGRPAVPAFELIVTAAQTQPGNGTYSAAISPDDIWPYLEAIREVDGILILDFQPGRAEYMDQLPFFEEFLLQPDVHVGLDPEWEMLPNQVPGEVVGQTDATSINTVMGYLQELVVENDLPPKIVVVHQFNREMISSRPILDPPSSVQLVMHMDGFGTPEEKRGNYLTLAAREPIFNGFKLFAAEDNPPTTPEMVAALMPHVDVVTYQ